jgi:signal transduction histidine kinase
MGVWVQDAARDLGRLSRLTAGCAGVAVAVLGLVTLPAAAPGVPPAGGLSDPAAALVPAGIALSLQVFPVAGRIVGRVVRAVAVLHALAAVAIGVTGLSRHPAAAVAIVLSGSALACLHVRVVRRAPDAIRYRVSDPLIAGAAISALLAFGPDPGLAGALLALALAAALTYPLRRPDHRLVDELNDRQAFADTLLQSMNEAVMVLDANHRVIDVNRRWRELTGHGPDEPIRFDPPPLPPAAGGDWLMPRVDGTSVPVLATMATIPDAEGAPRAYVATYVDIADRKRAEDSLSEQNTRLREANGRLETALAFKNDITSMLTHDVAQPISSIASLAELLRADWADLPEDIRLELATKIDKNTQRLIKMMNDLQLLFRLDMGSVTARRAPVPLLEVVEHVVAGTPGEPEVDIDENLAALADRGHLLAVVQNLLANAVAYGDPPVRVSAGRRGEVIELVVQDSGPGIPEELLGTVFDRFMRGAGLGLFIVRHLVEANGGTVRYERAEPRGARLLVTLESAPI